MGIPFCMSDGCVIPMFDGLEALFVPLSMAILVVGSPIFMPAATRPSAWALRLLQKTEDRKKKEEEICGDQMG